MSKVTKRGDGERMSYTVSDSGIERGRFDLDCDGCIHVVTDRVPGAGHFWIAPEDGEAWTALVKHVEKFGRGAQATLPMSPDALASWPTKQNL